MRTRDSAQLERERRRSVRTFGSDYEPLGSTAVILRRDSSHTPDSSAPALVSCIYDDPLLRQRHMWRAARNAEVLLLLSSGLAGRKTALQDDKVIEVLGWALPLFQ